MLQVVRARLFRGPREHLLPNTAAEFVERSLGATLPPVPTWGLASWNCMAEKSGAWRRRESRLPREVVVLRGRLLFRLNRVRQTARTDRRPAYYVSDRVPTAHRGADSPT